MALNSKKYERVFSTTGSDNDKIDTNTFNDIKNDFDSNLYIQDVGQFKLLGPALYQIQKLTEELDDLRSEISSNKDKVSMTLGTSRSTALAGDTALLALGTSGSTALAGDTNIVTIGSSTTISFGDMITTTITKKGVTTTTYSIVMTVTNGGVSKSTTLTLT
tara:strand:- start:106 stop:591 length:486 start_codon:yes stop_codon:yes gene_type:complete